MNLPTTEEIEAIFRDHWGEKDKDTQRDLRPLFQLAKKSETIKGCAIGGMQSMMTGVSLGGVDFAPVLILILMGFRLGVIWSGGASTSDPPISDDMFNKFMKSVTESTEEGEQEDGQTQS